MGKWKNKQKSGGGWSGLPGFGSGQSGGSQTSVSYGGGGHTNQRCYHSHQPYEIAPGLFVNGGSCISPAVTDADVYIGFDSGMPSTPISFPWNPGDEIYFKIVDRDVPKNLPEFRKLVAWTAEQIKAGRKVHAGCIGGHGRTGTFFAALRMEMTGDVKAIEHVRTHYCKKAVESRVQVEWLHEHFGIEKAEPTDHMHKASATPSYSQQPYHKPLPSTSTWKPGGVAAVTVKHDADAAGSIWAPEL